jgi:hypothetical protein
MQKDPRAEPQYSERVPYIIAHHVSSNRLVDAARFPEEVTLDPYVRQLFGF